TADKKMFDRFFADELIYTRATGAVITKKDVLKSLDEPLPPNTPTAVFSAEDVQVRQYGNVAIIAFKLVQKLSDGNTGYYRNTGTFLKRHGKWQAIGWQATPLPLKPPGSASGLPSGGKPGRG
ncbi:MAG TPA: nuclear transport factor 2 family protein, partial [Terriglobales bacterium]|nr:nuclear transport factor 2 family protein [Terriglobales bacterium]